jgi:hypothetical protein
VATTSTFRPTIGSRVRRRHNASISILGHAI